MPDFAGAKAAIRSRLDTLWTATPILHENAQVPDVWPPSDPDHGPQPWVMLEIECAEAPIKGTGVDGARTYTYNGTIMVHVFVPIGIGTTKLDELAVAVGEIFRRRTFYNATPGYYVRTEDPAPVGRPEASDDGNWYGVTSATDFTYWHRG